MRKKENPWELVRTCETIRVSAVFVSGMLPMNQAGQGSEMITLPRCWRDFPRFPRERLIMFEAGREESRTISRGYHNYV